MVRQESGANARRQISGGAFGAQQRCRVWSAGGGGGQCRQPAPGVVPLPMLSRDPAGLRTKFSVTALTGPPGTLQLAMPRTRRNPGLPAPAMRYVVKLADAYLEQAPGPCVGYQADNTLIRELSSQSHSSD